MKLVAIIALVVIAGLGIWRYTANKVDQTKPESVSAAFSAALKKKDVDKASKYWAPDGAEAWRLAATTKVNQMGSGSAERFFDEISDGSTAFTAAPKAPKAPANEMTMISGSTSLDLRQIDGKWYVCKAPL